MTQVNVLEKLQETVPPFLTLEQATEWIHLDVVNIRLAVHKGNLPAHRLPGGRTRLYILRHELIGWIGKRSTIPQNAPRSQKWAELYPDLPEQMDVKQIGDLLSVHPQVATRSVASGRLPGQKDYDGKWWVNRDQLLDYFADLPHTFH